MARWRKVGSVHDIPEGQGIGVEVEGKRVAIFNIEGEFFAIEATCAQHGAPLEKGVVHGERLHCPWHGAVFDVRAGICSAFPAEVAAAAYEVKVQGTDILLAL